MAQTSAPTNASDRRVAFVAFRVLHAVCYLTDKATLRSLAFVGALVCAIWLFLLGLL